MSRPMPAPRAVVETFTPPTIEFSLSVVLTDVNAGDRVKSDLHIAILEAFREAGIYGNAALTWDHSSLSPLARTNAPQSARSGPAYWRTLSSDQP